MRYLIILLSSLFLAACGGGGGESTTSTTQQTENNGTDNTTNTNATSYKLKTFNITGTSANDAQDNAPISPSVNGGEFALNWSLNNNSTMYKLALFVSNNDTLSDNDTQFYNQTCGGVLACGALQNESFKLSCFFNNSNQIYCNDAINDKATLTAFLDVIPKNAHIIIKSCTLSGLAINCDTKASKVQFN